MKKKIFKINKEKQEQKPKKLFLMITVLERGKSQKFIPILEKHDVVVQMTMLGKGTASSEILNCAMGAMSISKMRQNTRFLTAFHV